jgi:hypothetical protein
MAAWVNSDIEAPGAVSALCAELDSSALASRATLFSDPRWSIWHANHKDRTTRVYSYREQGRLTGLATFFVHPSSFRLALGELTFFSRPVRRLDAFAAPLIECNGDRTREAFMLTELIERLREDLKSNELIFLEGLEEGSAMFGLLTQLRSVAAKFHALQYGKLYKHRFAVIPTTFDDYLKQLGSRTRADLRTNRKRFIAHVGGVYQTRCFRTPGDVPVFLRDSMEISEKTYQYRLLSSGLRDAETLERCYLSAAELGWFRSYILYAHERPVAFQVGYVYRGRFHAEEIGYDPEWAQHHVGIFLHTEIVTDLAASGGAVTEFDFGRDDVLHKQRLSTGYRVEGYFYLFPNHFQGSAMAISLRATNYVSSRLGIVLERFGARTKVRNLLRKLGAAR